LTDIVLAVPLGAASFQRALETMSPEIAARVRERRYRVRDYFARKEGIK
jgi:hypothetical protein